MELTIGDRLRLTGVLPPEGNIVTMKIVRQLKMDLGFSEEEVAEHNIRAENGRIFWDGDFVKDIPIGPKAMATIVESLQRLDASGKVSVELVELYDRFVGTEE